MRAALFTNFMNLTDTAYENNMLDYNADLFADLFETEDDFRPVHGRLRH